MVLAVYQSLVVKVMSTSCFQCVVSLVSAFAQSNAVASQTSVCVLNAKMPPVSEVRVGCACTWIVTAAVGALESETEYESWNGNPAKAAVVCASPKSPSLYSITFVEPFVSITRTPGQRSSEIVAVARYDP